MQRGNSYQRLKLFFFFSHAGMNVEAISEERASRSLYRIKLLSKIREEVWFEHVTDINLKECVAKKV